VRVCVCVSVWSREQREERREQRGEERREERREKKEREEGKGKIEKSAERERECR
jgi:hypothetical protein